MSGVTAEAGFAVCLPFVNLWTLRLFVTSSNSELKCYHLTRLRNDALVDKNQKVSA